MKSKSKAPDRIWVWWDNGYDVGMVNTHGDKRYTPSVAQEYAPAARIEELEAQRNFAQKQVVMAEAKLAKAVEVLGGVMRHMPDHPDTVWIEASETLAELTGGKDD